MTVTTSLSHMYLNDTGHERIPVKIGIFDTRIRFGTFSAFLASRLCGMVGVANHSSHWTKTCAWKQQTRFSIPAAAAWSSSARAQRYESHWGQGHQSHWWQAQRSHQTVFTKRQYTWKTWKGRTISVEADLKHTMDIVKRRVEAKTRIPMDDKHLVASGKVLKDNIPLKEYGISGGETIELTAQLLGGMKHKTLSSKTMDTERDKKRKEFEPYIDAGGTWWCKATFRTWRRSGCNKKVDVGGDERTKRADGWHVRTWAINDKSTIWYEWR